MKLLQTNQFIKLNHDSQKSIQGKIQRILREFKNILSFKKYYQLCPIVSCSGKFYGTAEIHKLPVNRFTDNLPQRSTVSSIDKYFNIGIYIQIGGVAMGSPLGPLIINIFMIELESILVPKLNHHVKIMIIIMVKIIMIILFTSNVVRSNIL